MKTRDKLIAELENEGIKVTAWHPTLGIPNWKLALILKVLRSYPDK